MNTSPNKLIIILVTFFYNYRIKHTRKKNQSVIESTNHYNKNIYEKNISIQSVTQTIGSDYDNLHDYMCLYKWICTGRTLDNPIKQFICHFLTADHQQKECQSHQN